MSDRLRILVVCTGNICRSPLAERLLHARLGEQAEVSSAGVRGLDASAMDPLAAGELQRLGGDSTGFKSRRLSAADVAAAGLVITMTRAHRSEVLAVEPRGLHRTFTLLELAHLLQQESAPFDPGSAIAWLAANRSAATPDEYDIADPIGRPAKVHAEVADQIAAAVDIISAALTPR